MSGISVIKGWYDVHYTDNSTEIPSKQHVLPNPDITLEGPFNPSKNREFSEIRLELPFSQAMNLSYLQIEYDFNNGDNQVFYAWVDDVRLLSDSQNAPMVNVLYHIDFWRTFNKKFIYGSGFVKRKPSDDIDFWQSYAYRFLKESMSLNVLNKLNSYKGTVKWWALIATQVKDGDKVSRIKFVTFPVITDVFLTNGDRTKKGRTPNFKHIFLAQTDELLGLDPTAITGAWLSPIQPLGESIIGDGSENNPFGISSGDNNWFYNEKTYAEKMYSSFGTTDVSGLRQEVFFIDSMTFSSMKSTEIRQLKLCGPCGETLGMFPFGITFDSVTTYLVVSSASAYLRMVFGNPSEGMVFDYILPTIDINSNAWSSYVYSGQRDYEIATRSLQTKDSTIDSTLSNTLFAAGSGALVGMGIGSAAGPIGAAVGAIAGAGASIIGGIIDESIVNPKIQEEEDKLHANQSEYLLLAGDSYYCFTKTDGEIRITIMEPDDSSLQAIDNNKAVQGVKYGQNVENCTQLIESGGPLQINNLIVNGNAPIGAKNWVKQKFAAGVRIIDR